MPDKVNTGLNAWQRLQKMFSSDARGFFVGMVVIGCIFFLWKGNGDEDKWRKLYEKERQSNVDCDRRNDSLQREYNLFLKGYAPLVQRQIERTENLKDSIKNNSHE